MKRTAEILVVFGAFALTPFARAGNLDVEIHCVPRKVNEKVNPGSGPGGKAVTTENWVYDVTIENKTFRDLVNLEVKYLIFFKQEHLGSKEAAAPLRQNGSLTLPILRAHEKKSLTTNPVELTKAKLIGDWYYPSGAKPGAQGTVTGLWVRIYQNGQPFAEYANPSILAREKWE